MTQPDDDARRTRLLALAAQVAAADTDEDALAIMRDATGLTITDPIADRAELARRIAALQHPAIHPSPASGPQALAGAVDRAVFAAQQAAGARLVTGGDLCGQLLNRGCVIVAARDPDDPLHGDPYAYDPDNLMLQLLEWLDRHRLLTQLPAGEALDEVLDRFLADRREARALSREEG